MAGASYILEIALFLLASYGLVSLAGLISERSGVVNIALDGKMIIGALVYASLMNVSGFKETFNYFSPFMAMFLAGIGGMAYSTLLSVATINFLADHIIAGTALNLLAPALSIIVVYAAFDQEAVDVLDKSMGWAGEVSTTAIISVMITGVILALAWFFINKTTMGLRLRSAGENPYSLETSGISVKKTKWIALTIAGFLAGFGGAIAINTFARFTGTVNGMGFIALAILIMGQWKVAGITIGTIIIGISMAFFTGWGFLDTNIADELMMIITFILPIIVLILFKSSNAPEAAGKPYRKDMR